MLSSHTCKAFKLVHHQALEANATPPGVSRLSFLAAQAPWHITTASSRKDPTLLRSGGGGTFFTNVGSVGWLGGAGNVVARRRRWRNGRVRNLQSVYPATLPPPIAPAVRVTAITWAPVCA